MKSPNITAVITNVQSLATMVGSCLDRTRSVKTHLVNAGFLKELPANGLTEPQIDMLHVDAHLRELDAELSALKRRYEEQIQNLQGVQQPAAAPVADSAPTPAPVVQLQARPVTLAHEAAPIASPEVVDRRQALRDLAQRQQEEAAAAQQRSAEASAARAAARAVAAANLENQRQAVQAALTPQPSAPAAPDIGLPTVQPIKRIPQAAPATAVQSTARVANAYDRLMEEESSPLLNLFACAAWLPNGRGEMTVGSTAFPGWHEDFDLDAQDFQRLVTLPSGFYGNENELPKYVVIRLRSCIMIWNFKLGGDDLRIFRNTGNLEQSDLTFRSVRTCTTSTIRCVLEEMEAIHHVQASGMRYQ